MRRENGKGWDARVKWVRDARGGGRQEPSELTSFFFSNFPDEMNEVGLWRIFQRWGKVRDVMVAGKRTKAGKRFIFVRYEGVRNNK